MGDAAAGLAPQLRPRRLVVGLRVGGIAVLVGLEGAGDLLREPVGDAVVRLRRLGRDVGRGDHDLGPVGPQQVDLLARHLVRHHRDHAVALQAGGDGEARAGVAGGRLDDRPAGAQAPVALGGLDEAHGDAVLDRPAGVEQLQLGHELRRQARPDPAQPDHRRLADGVEDGVLDLRAGVRLGHASESRTGSSGDRVVEVHDAVAEAALAQELEADAEAVGQGGVAAADDDGREEEVALVDEAGAERVRGELGPPTVRSRSAAAFIRRTSSGSNSRSIRVLAVDGSRSVRE